MNINSKPKIFNSQLVAIILSILALLISISTFWYNFIREGKPIFVCSRWTAIGMENTGQQGATFAVNISVINDGNTPLEILDFLLVAETHNNKKIFYDPILLFDLTNYISTLDEDNRIAKAQKGQIPLPLIVSPNQHYTFEDEILFMPYNKITSIINNVDAPFTLKLFVLTDRADSYIKISEQKFRIEDIQRLVNGSFSGVLSNTSTEYRKNFIDSYK